MNEEFRTLDTYEVIEDTSVETGDQGDRGEASTSSIFDLGNFVANEIGAKEGRILSGSVEEPIEYSLSELTPKQQVAILKDYYSKANTTQAEAPSFTDDEMFVINSLREGKLEDLYGQLSEELGKGGNPTPTQYSDDDYISWKIQSDIPDLSQEELEFEVESFKASPLYDKRLDSIKNQYSQVIESQQQQVTFQQQQEVQANITELQNEIIDIAKNTNDVFDFELDDNVKNLALQDLIEPNEETGNPALIDFLGTPEGLTQTAMLWRAMPEINEYVNTLHKEVERLKANSEREPNNKTVVSTSNYNMYEDEFDEIPELKPI